MYSVTARPTAWNKSRRYLEEARMLGFLLKVHAEQFSIPGATRLGIELEAVSVDHLDHVNWEDIRLLARSATVASSVARIGSST